MTHPKRILFLPVSSAKGMGEYVRSLCLAKNLAELHPELKIAFGLNRHATYFGACPFEVFPLTSSPTQVSKEVIAIFKNYQPDLAVFDASGRAAQLAYCKKNRIKTVFVAQHKKKLNKGLGFRRLKHTDLLLATQPQFMMGTLGFWKSCLLKYYREARLIYVGPIFSETSDEQAQQYLRENNLQSNDFILFNAGGGGNRVNVEGKKILAADLFLEVATKLSADSMGVKQTIVVVLGQNYPEIAPKNIPKNIRLILNCDELQFNALLKNAHASLLSGGSSLLQALACGAQSILAVPIASDQKARVKECKIKYGIEICGPSAEPMLRLFKAILLKQEGKKTAIKREIKNGLPKATSEIMNLLNSVDSL